MSRYVIGRGVWIPSRVVALLAASVDFPAVRNRWRGVDAEVAEVLEALASEGLRWREVITSARTGSSVAQQAEVPAQSVVRRGWLTTPEAAERLGIGDRGVRDAIAGGRIAARKVNGRWQVDAADVEHYRVRRRAP